MLRGGGRKERIKKSTRRSWQKNKSKYYLARIAVIREAKDVPCKDCRHRYPFYVMQFDHLPEYKKLIKLSTASKLHSKEAVRTEIAKCEVVCANCHAERTFQRRQTSF